MLSYIFSGADFVSNKDIYIYIFYKTQPILTNLGTYYPDYIFRTEM